MENGLLEHCILLCCIKFCIYLRRSIHFINGKELSRADDKACAEYFKAAQKRSKE
jgi:hypothetical protein